MIVNRQEIENQFGITYIESLEFFSEKIFQKIKRLSERKLRWKKHAQVNRWAALLFEEPLVKKKEISYVIKKVNPLVGHGVFATKAIGELSYVGEYAGIVRKRRRWKDSSNEYVFSYVIGPHDTVWVIDAKERGNFTRFINHSYEPNLTSKWIIVNNIAHVVFFANRLILPGEQLTYDYGPYYWRKRSYPEAL